jgi:hypothetical protein
MGGTRKACAKVSERSQIDTIATAVLRNSSSTAVISNSMGASLRQAFGLGR